MLHALLAHSFSAEMPVILLDVILWTLVAIGGAVALFFLVYKACDMIAPDKGGEETHDDRRA